MTMRRSLLVVLMITLSLGYLYVTVAVPRSQMRQREQTRRAMEAYSFECPAGAQVRIEPWGESGLSRGCYEEGKRNGSWQAWDQEQLVIKGRYASGEPSGIWEWFDNGGNVVNERRFSGGLED